MRIVSIQLKNIKSHKDTELTFSSGINVLSGANGSGKSTIFQAIGYALFGVSAQDFTSRADRFLTIGAKRGEVSVIFEPGDGERYRVSRTVGPAAKWLLAKEAGESFEIEEHANIQETEARIASLLGLSGGRPLADQFKLVIGPFQNDFLGPFVIRQPTRRQDAFDEILGIDAWRKTFDGTKTLASTIAAKTDTLQAEIAGKLEQVAVLPAKELELAGLKEASSAKQAELEKRQAELEAVAARLAGLDAKKERIESVQVELQGVEQKISSGKEYVTNQQLLVEQSRKAAEIVAAASAGKKAYDAAESRLKELREQEKEKSQLEKKLAELEKEQSGIKASLQVELRELTESRTKVESDGAAIAEEEKALADADKELEVLQLAATSGLAAAKKALNEFRELPIHNIALVSQMLKMSLDAITSASQQLSERQAELTRSAELKAKAEELPRLEAELEKAQAEKSQLAGRRLSLLEGCEKMEAGDCPFFHEPCQNLVIGGGVGKLRTDLEALERKIAELDAIAEARSKLVAVAQEAARELIRVDQVRLELEKVAKAREGHEEEFKNNLSKVEPGAMLAAATSWLASLPLRIDLGQQLRELEVVIAGTAQERRDLLLRWSDGWRVVIASLEQTLSDRLREAEEPVQKCKLGTAELAARGRSLEEKKREIASAREKALHRERAVDAHQKRLDALLGEVAAQKEGLSAYAGLEGAIKASGQELERLQPERDRYIANLKNAEDLDKNRDTLGKYQKRLQDLGEQLVARREELTGLQAGYQAEEHEKARLQREAVVSALATLKAELAGIAEGVARLLGEIKALTVVADEIAKKQGEIVKLNEQAALVKFLRNQVFKNVSAQLSERFREEISSRADRIYRCISESDEELYWGEGYQVVLKDMVEGAIRERTDDQLSGGQMMSAVVALRLALLQTIGARMAFFDEPTSNLDAERRENLAKAFRAIDVGQEEVTEHWYDQLFLVSHDVSFTEITDQMISLD